MFGGGGGFSLPKLPNPAEVVDRVVKNPVGSVIGAVTTGSPFGAIAGSELADGPKAPDAPGVDPNLAKLKEKQLKQAGDFRQNMPNMVRIMSEDLKRDSNQAMNAGVRKTREDYASRGLVHSGLRQGAEAGKRAQAQAGLAQGVSAINADMENAANTLDAQAVETSLGVQQTQQAIQNQIYSQAQARLAGQNHMVGSAIGGIGGGLISILGGRA